MRGGSGKDGCTMTKWLRRTLVLLLVVIFSVSAVKVIRQVLDYQKGQKNYSEALEMAGVQQPDGTDTAKSDTEATVEAETDSASFEETLAAIDLDSLQTVNSDVIGWIAIPDTKISYPLLRTDNNDYYLNRTWNKERNSVGSIFMEYRVSPDFSDFHTIIYGHRMRDGSMFGGLKFYGDMEYWREHPSVYIVNEAGIHQYDIFAAHEMGTSRISESISISGDAEKQDFIRYSLQHSAIDTDIVPTEQDHVLSLITCTGRGYSTRWVIQAVLNEKNMTG